VTEPQFIKTRHGEVAVHVDEQPGEPIVMLHGLGGDHHQVQAFLPEPRITPDIVMQRIAVDMRGHGDTAVLGDPSTLNIRSFAEDVRDVILGLDQVNQATPLTVLGISMGAAVTIEFTCGFPELVSRIILIRPSWDGRSRAEHSAVFPVLSRFLAESGPAGLDPFMETPEYQAVAELSPTMAASLRKQFARKDAQQRAAVLEYIPRSAGMRTEAEISTISVPALVLGAPNDPNHPLEFAETLAGVIPNARLVRLPVKLESPGDHEAGLRAAVSGFLRATRRQ
jgi:pimeloyl-ACP methyl ester carboxylesterase